MRLKNIEDRFEEIYHIYEEAFPKSEKRTKEGQLAVMKNAYYRLLVHEEEGKILAFLGYWELPGCCFVEHLATTGACRGKGYGKHLVIECIKESKKPLFLEIEPVTDEDPMTARRAAFYQRLGFHCNFFPYCQMPLKAGDHPIRLWVMSYGKVISEKEFQPFKKEILENVYQVTLSD